MTEEMSSLRQLNDDEQMQLNDWLAIKHIGLNHRTRRDLSDVVNMALLFKKIDNKLVDIKNFTSHGKLALKLLNWESFNLKVLRKTGLILRRPALEQLALGDMNAMRSLLFHLMSIERDGIQLSSRCASPTKDQQRLSPDAGGEFQCSIDTLGQSPSEILIRTPSQTDAQANQVANTNANCEELKRINGEKDKYISTLTQKVHYLETVILDEEQRTNQLTEHLSTLSMRIIAMQKSLADEENLPTAPPTTFTDI